MAPNGVNCKDGGGPKTQFKKWGGQFFFFILFQKNFFFSIKLFFVLTPLCKVWVFGLNLPPKQNNFGPFFAFRVFWSRIGLILKNLEIKLKKKSFLFGGGGRGGGDWVLGILGGRFLPLLIKKNYFWKKGFNFFFHMFPF